MQTANQVPIRERVSALVSAILLQNNITVTFAPEARLADIGMTSMDMVGLMLGVEAEFDIAIPQAEITAENFQSVLSIEQLVERQFAAARGKGSFALHAVA